MAKDRRIPYRAQFDGHRRLAAAVILQAIKDTDATAMQERETAVEFLQGDMWPYSDVLEIPHDGNALKEYLRQLKRLTAE